MYTTESLIAELERTHARLLSLVLDLADAQRAVPWHPGINPPVWELGHAAFFYEVFVLRRLDGIAPLMPGYDPVWDSFDIDHRDRWTPGVVPDLDRTLKYADEVISRVKARILDRPLTDEALYLYRYAIFHEQMHIESQIWLRQTLGYPAPFGVRPRTPETSVQPVEDVQVPAGTWYFGMPADSGDDARDGFAFDAEKPGFSRELPGFAISPRLVTQGEFLAFVEDGGYTREDLWSFGGRKWLKALRSQDPDPVRPDEPAQGPIYWRQEGGRWYRRWFDQWLPLNPAQPMLHVSFWEAEAWCNWAGRRLPTEFEWEAAALANRPEATHRRYPWGHTPATGRADLGSMTLGTASVDDFGEGDSPLGLRQALGTAWEWTASQFLPYDGFRTDMYPFMSTLQFGYHKTTKGGSCATEAPLIRGTYRQAYLPQRRDVFTGFRTCAKEDT